MASENNSTFDRRQMLKCSLAGASIAALGACASNVGHSTSSSMISDAELEDRKHEIKQRLRFRMDSGNLIWTIQGRVFAQKGSLIIPMFDLVHCVFAQLEPRLNGGFDMKSFELGFRTDLKTGERLTEYRNPFNQEKMTVPYAPVGPIELVYTPEIHLQIPDMIGGSKIFFNEQPDVFSQADNMIYMDQNSQTRVVTEGKPERIINEIATIFGDAKALTDKSVNFAPAKVFNSDISDYARWMNMSAEFGNQTFRAVGHKINNVEQIPAKWMNIIKEVDPEIYKNPMSVLNRDEAKYLG